MPHNIVEAYAIASRAAKLNPKMRLQEFDRVIAFCESDENCRVQNSLKRNTLLLWAYDNVAKIMLAEQKSEQALALWQKARELPCSAQAKIRLGNKMLDAVNRGHFNIAEKAAKIAEIAAYLQQAYSEADEKEESQRMQRLWETASYLLSASKSEH